jgi:hypothetical protein
MLYSCSRGGAIATAEAEAYVKVVKKVINMSLAMTGKVDACS